MKGNQDNTQMAVYQSEALRGLVSFVNEQGIKQNDIVSFFQDGRTHEFVLIYYK